MASETHAFPKFSQASISTGRSPKRFHIAISNAPVSEAGTIPTLNSSGIPKISLVLLIAFFSLALPILDLCDLPRADSFRLSKFHVGGLVQGLSEALYFAENAGLDGRAVIDVISKGAAQSWQMENRFETMVDDEFDFGFAVDWMVKDLGICLDEATRNEVSLPVTELVKTYYEEVQAMGGGRWDTSSLIRRLRGLK